MRVTNFFLLGIALIFAGCKDEKKVDDSAIRYRHFKLEKAGWKSKEHLQQVDDMDFTATEVPISYYILKSEGNADLFAVDSIEKANEKERVLEFIFKHDNDKNLLETEFTGLNLEETVKYMSFDITNDFYLVTDKKDTINCSGVIFERNFNMVSDQKLILFFSGINPTDKIQLVYNDQLFKKGILKFKFEEKTTKLLL